MSKSDKLGASLMRKVDEVLDTFSECGINTSPQITGELLEMDIAPLTTLLSSEEAFAAWVRQHHDRLVWSHETSIIMGAWTQRG